MIQLDTHMVIWLAGRADALVLSACVQMPSLASIQPVEDEAGLPVLSAATSTAFRILAELGLPPVVPRAGSLLGSAATDR